MPVRLPANLFCLIIMVIYFCCDKYNYILFKIQKYHLNYQRILKIYNYIIKR